MEPKVVLTRLSVDFIKNYLSQHMHNSNKNTDPRRAERQSKKFNIPCPFCKILIDTKGHLDIHLRTHTRERVHMCNHCPKSFTIAFGLRTHICGSRDVQKCYKCTNCSAAFEKLSELESHVRAVHRKKEFKCDVCFKTFSCKLVLESHSEIHKETTHRCENPDCGRNFKTLSALRGHLTKVHGDVRNRHSQDENGSEVIKCQTCNKIFPTQKQLKAHAPTHSKLYKCSECNSDFSSASNLSAHARVHFTKPFSCNYCSAPFATARELDTHVLAHQGKLTFDCPHCPKKFSKQNNLDKHKVDVHTTRPKIYECPFDCQKKFTTLSNLKSHLRSHTKEKPYFCASCPQSFGSPQALRQHEFRHVQTEKDRKFACTFCSMKFFSLNNLNLHLNTHTKSKVHECGQCGKSLMSKFSLNTHLLMHGGVRSQKCQFCPKAFCTLRALRTHYLIHTGELHFKCEFCGERFGQRYSLNKHMRSHTKERPIKLCRVWMNNQTRKFDKL